MSKEIRFNAFMMNCVGHLAPVSGPRLKTSRLII